MFRNLQAILNVAQSNICFPTRLFPWITSIFLENQLLIRVKFVPGNFTQLIITLAKNPNELKKQPDYYAFVLYRGPLQNQQVNPKMYLQVVIWSAKT